MKRTMSAVLAAASLMLALPSHADVANFEDINTDGDWYSLQDFNPYQGLNWDSNFFVGDTSIGGYDNGAHSGVRFVTNGRAADSLSVSSVSGTFNFAGAWFATPASNGAKASWIAITAYDANNQVLGTTGQIGISQHYSWVAANFSGVTRLTITRDQGNFAMDDFSFTSAVPEPASLPMLGLGLAMLGWRYRRRAG